MATYTTNLELIKPAGTDKIRIAQINQNMDTIDNAIGAVGNTSLQAQVTAAANSLNAVEGGVAIVSNNNAHSPIASGQYVYIKNNATLAEGMYVATQSIGANGELTLSNVTPVSGGAINALQSATNQALLNHDLGSFSTLNALGTALKTYIDSLPVGAERYVSFALTAVALPFSDTTYFANVKRAQNGNHLCEARTILTNNIITGRYRTSTSLWYWEEAAVKSEVVLKSDIKIGFLDGSVTGTFEAGQTKEFTMPVQGSAVFICPQYYGLADSFAWVMRNNSSGYPVIRIKNITSTAIENPIIRYMVV